MYKIATVTPEPPHTLHLVFTDGASVTADVRSLIERGGVFAPLADPDVFAQVRIGPRNRTVVWLDDLDLDADTFRSEAYHGAATEFPLTKGRA